MTHHNITSFCQSSQKLKGLGKFLITDAEICLCAGGATNLRELEADGVDIEKSNRVPDGRGAEPDHQYVYASHKLLLAAVPSSSQRHHVDIQKKYKSIVMPLYRN